MQTETTLRPRTSGRFAALMDLYERNYMLVRLLAPGLRSMASGTHRSTPEPGDNAPTAAGDLLPLDIVDLRHDRYTSTFRLTYRLSPRYERDREPDLAIRLYHDARTCEVMSGLLPDETVELRRTRDLDEGHRLNAFLNRWLAYCLRQGHGFEGARAGRRRGELAGRIEPATSTPAASTIPPVR